jgi:hypothetical protein
MLAAMSMIVRRNVSELPETSRQGIEQLVGTPLEANQRVFVIVESPLRMRHEDNPSSPKLPIATRRETVQ